MSEKFETLVVPGPTITSVTKPFWDGIEKKQFLLQQCGDCQQWVFYPRTICPHCWSNNLEWKAASGKAKLKTWGIVHRPGHPAWSEIAPYVLGVVELEEGPTMMTHLLLDPEEEFKIGLPLEVSYTKCNERWLPFFKRLSN
ncbi:OB-fold domain-containing protein [Bacillus sp. FJAT-50079]|uniref:Zn-ribbon domain-containing OB-fold protein n=1 Tax=Bacillus sp. FJAT-50079 TaxID=2833577 RepID=UPI001BC8D431|nr:OB-fold domain-containing protein [Bacillus sp. FJAT-50079]MBS4209389.1 OB-fold domain-containing protein [Bacillus sp. FJAT-50079]